MSLERILLIKQHESANHTTCKKALEDSAEKFAVSIASDYQEGYRLLKEYSQVRDMPLNAVLVDTDEVSSRTLDLLSYIRGANFNLPVIVLTNAASSATRRALTSMSSECIIKTGNYERYLWQALKSSLSRYTNIRINRPLKVKKNGNPFAFKRNDHN